MGDDFLAKEFELAHGVGVGRAGPLESEVEVIDAEFVAVAADLVDYLLGVADEEAVPGELMEGNGEGLAFRELLVLAPGGVGCVLAFQVGTAFGVGGCGVGGDVKLPHHGHSFGEGLAGLGGDLSVVVELVLDQCRWWRGD